MMQRVAIQHRSQRDAEARVAAALDRVRRCEGLEDSYRALVETARKRSGEALDALALALAELETSTALTIVPHETKPPVTFPAKIAYRLGIHHEQKKIANS